MKKKSNSSSPAAGVIPSEATAKRIRFGELVWLEQLAPRERVEQCLALQEESQPDLKIGEILQQEGLLSDEEVAYILELQATEDLIEGYVLLEEIGRGGMGIVYRALQKSLQRQVAMKVLDPEGADRPRFRSRFFREARLSGRLNHPNIVSGIDFGQSNGLFYYAMEYVEGCSLGDILRHQGTLDQASCLDIGIQIAKALIHANQHRIIHRDLKPDDILVTTQGVAKLTDLGLSKCLDTDCFLTRAGKTLGTPHYLSPELARGLSSVDIRTDIYSLGATLYRAAVGRPPFHGETAAQIMARHVCEDVLPPRERNEALSEDFSDLICHMMARKLKDRLPTPEAMLAEMIAVRKGSWNSALAESAELLGSDSGSDLVLEEASSEAEATVPLPRRFEISASRRRARRRSASDSHAGTTRSSRSTSMDSVLRRSSSRVYLEGPGPSDSPWRRLGAPLAIGLGLLLAALLLLWALAPTPRPAMAGHYELNPVDRWQSPADLPGAPTVAVALLHHYMVEQPGQVNEALKGLRWLQERFGDQVVNQTVPLEKELIERRNAQLREKFREIEGRLRSLFVKQEYLTALEEMDRFLEAEPGARQFLPAETLRNRIVGRIRRVTTQIEQGFKEALRAGDYEQARELLRELRGYPLPEVNRRRALLEMELRRLEKQD